MLRCPTVDLFLYDLAQGLGQNPDDVETNRQRFSDRLLKLPNDQRQELHHATHQTGDYVRLLGETQVFHFADIDGYYYPVKLDDTYALQVDSSGELSPGFSDRPVTTLKTIKQDLCQHLKGEPVGTVGQSWFVWGQLTQPDQNVMETAKACCAAVLPEADWKWNVEFQPTLKETNPVGRLLEATLVEVWQPPQQSDSGQNDPAQNRHLLICLFPSHYEINHCGKLISDLYPHLLQGFRYRNKVIWASRQGQDLKTTLKRASKQVQDLVRELPHHLTSEAATNPNLSDLQKSLANSLTLFALYAPLLSRLEIAHQTVEVNLGNYQKRLHTIAQLDPAADLDNLHRFNNFATSKYLSQFATDLTTHRAELTLLENLIKTIEGIIALEQAKQNEKQEQRDRRLNETVAITGIGLATSQIASGAFLAQSPNQANLSTFNYRVQLVSISVGVGLFFAGLLWLIFHLPRRKG